MSIPVSDVPGNPPSRSRVRIFVPVFVLACVVSLGWVFARPAVYASIARLQVEPGKVQGQAGELEPASILANAAQALTASAILDQLRPLLPPGPPGADVLRGMLSATPVAGSNVIELRAEGREPGVLPQLLDAWIDAYRRSQSDSFDRTSGVALEDARAELARLKGQIAAQRLTLEQFRRKHDIVSLERDENQTTARLRSLNEAMNDARNKQAKAEARLASMRANLAAGKPLPEAAERSIVVELERRAAELRERMKDLEQGYTAQYLAVDSKYLALRTNLARLEQQIEQERKASDARSLQKEEQDIEGARETLTRLQQELTGRKREALDFDSRLAESRALAKELTSLEEAQGAAQERVSQLEGEKKAARPALTVLGIPTVPDRPDRPDYWRDAVIAVAGAGALGFLAVWFVEFFRRSGVAPAQIATQPIINIALAPGVVMDRDVRVIGASPVRERLPGPVHHLPDAVGIFPRELSSPEVSALWRAATPDARIAIAGLMNGLSLEELAALRYRHVDWKADVAHMTEVSTRACALREPLRRLLIERLQAKGGESPLADARGNPFSAADIEGLIACAAHDAGLVDPEDVTAEALRHTYFAYLIRQGVRLAEIGEFVGHVAPAAFRGYARLSPPGPGLPPESVDPVFPALREKRAT